jgi:MYXO-CTERM domain-containing protein
MDFHPGTGVLYAVAERGDGSDVPVLITIDLGTGAGTEVATLNGGAPHFFGDAYSDISFRADGALYTYLDPNDGLGTIDLGTGALTQLGTTNVGCCGNGIAFSGAGALFHANDTALHTLDQTTGAAAQVALLGFPFGQVFPRVNAMDFDPDTGTLYAAVRRDFANYLATVNPVTGAVTMIGGSQNGLDALAVFVAVPEPGGLALLALAALWARARRQSSAA